MFIIILAYCYSVLTIGLLYFFLKNSLTVKMTLKRSILWWMIFGFVFNFLSFTWLYTVYPLIWLPEGIVQIGGIFIIQLIMSIAASLGFCVVGWSMTLSGKEFFKPGIFAMSLVIAEMARALLISLLFKGEGSTVAFHYTSGTLGDALAPTPFVEAAYFGGIFGLTFVLGYLIYCFVSKKHITYYWKHTLVFIAILLFVHFCIPTYGPSHPVKVAVITTNFSTTQDNEIDSAFKKQNKVLDDMTQSFVTTQPDILVYPEDARYIEYLPEKERRGLSVLFPHSLFIDGSTHFFNGKMANISLFYSSGTQKATAGAKSFLLPFNEYIPYFFRPIFSLFVPKDQMDDYLKNHTYTPIHSSKTTTFNGLTVGTLLCSEILSHSTISEVGDENPSLVFFQSHLNVFHDNPLAWAILYSATKVAAAQLRRPVISSINGAPSFIVSPHGKIITTLPTGFSTSTYTFSK